MSADLTRLVESFRVTAVPWQTPEGSGGRCWFAASAFAGHLGRAGVAHAVLRLDGYTAAAVVAGRAWSGPHHLVSVQGVWSGVVDLWTVDWSWRQVEPDGDWPRVLPEQQVRRAWRDVTDLGDSAACLGRELLAQRELVDLASGMLAGVEPPGSRSVVG